MPPDVPKPTDSLEDQEDLERFGRKLASLRKLRALSQEKLAELIGTDGNRISRIERGRVNVTLVTLFALARALEVRPERLLAWPRKRSKKPE